MLEHNAYTRAETFITHVPVWYFSVKSAWQNKRFVKWTSNQRNWSESPVVSQSLPRYVIKTLIKKHYPARQCCWQRESGKWIIYIFSRIDIASSLTLLHQYLNGYVAKSASVCESTAKTEFVPIWFRLMCEMALYHLHLQSSASLLHRYTT